MNYLVIVKLYYQIKINFLLYIRSIKKNKYIFQLVLKVKIYLIFIFNNIFTMSMNLNLNFLKRKLEAQTYVKIFKYLYN